MTKTVTIVGQGYVGLPLAKAAAAAGWKVYGFDVNNSVVSALNSGVSHIDDLSDGDIRDMLSRGYEPTDDASVISSSDFVSICVPTPLQGANEPDLGAIQTACTTVANHLRPGTTVILESTTYPGTTEDVCLPILERSGLKCGTDFLLAFSPERVDPGSRQYGIINTPKLVGGFDAPATERAASFYSTFVDTVVPMKGTKEAEMAKLLENTFRHVNIALVNEMARFCHDLDIDIWDVIKGASTKPFGFMPFRPGPGVGGHCIPIDPNYLSYEVKKELGYPFRFVELAQEINASMPAYVVQRLSEILNSVKKAVNGSSVLLLGVTYKPNVSDRREAPSLPIAKLLLKAGADVAYHDPFVPEWHVDDTVLTSEKDYIAAAARADVTVILQAHESYNVPSLSTSARLLFDATGVATDPATRL